MGKSFNIVRVNTPDFHSADYQAMMMDGERFRRLLGDQPDFAWALPSVFRALANPLAPAVFPKKPDARKDFFGAIAYWHSLQWFLIYRLGWAFPGKGMRELYNYLCMPAPEMETNLKFLSELWFEDGYLPNYLSWAFHGPYLKLQRHEGIEDSWPDLSLESDSFIRRTPEGMHLEPGGYHYFIFDEIDPDGYTFLDGGKNTGKLVIDSAWGWYELLRFVGEKYRSYLIEVHVPSFGLMGHYQYSERTGLWYTGSHEVHLMGN